jgi:hypothetical protein
MQLEQCERSGFRYSLSTALPAQFATETQDVQFARVHTEDKKYGDLTFGCAIYQQTQHRVLASSERLYKPARVRCGGEKGSRYQVAL